MSTPLRISVEKTREMTLSGEALLVCGYEETNQFLDNNLERAISWQTFESRLPDLSKDQEIIFYCA